MPFLNLAPLLFRNVTQTDGPIEKIDLFEYTNSFGENQFEANAYLKPYLKSPKILKSSIYGNCDGSGTANSKVNAARKSIAEALERWAFYKLASEDSKQFGLDIDDTSTGFAALPCWPRRAARMYAFKEAIERWALSNWWNGKLNLKRIEVHPNFDCWEILTPFKHMTVNIVSQKVIKSNGSAFYVYGFAGGYSKKESIEKAFVEMERNHHALSIAFEKNLSYETIEDISDKRLLYFASEEGHAVFSKKASDISERIRIGTPKLLVDSEIRGPWSRYAVVWRCLLEGTDTDLEKPDFFLF